MGWRPLASRSPLQSLPGLPALLLQAEDGVFVPGDPRLVGERASPGRGQAGAAFLRRASRSLLNATSPSSVFKSRSYRGSPPPRLRLPGGKVQKVEVVPEATEECLIAF